MWAAPGWNLTDLPHWPRMVLAMNISIRMARNRPRLDGCRFWSYDHESGDARNFSSYKDERKRSHFEV
jgi:hypothetical protein